MSNKLGGILSNALNKLDEVESDVFFDYINNSIPFGAFSLKGEYTENDAQYALNMLSEFSVAFLEIINSDSIDCLDELGISLADVILAVSCYSAQFLVKSKGINDLSNTYSNFILDSDIQVDFWKKTQDYVTARKKARIKERFGNESPVLQSIMGKLSDSEKVYLQNLLDDTIDVRPILSDSESALNDNEDFTKKILACNLYMRSLLAVSEKNETGKSDLLEELELCGISAPEIQFYLIANVLAPALRVNSVQTFNQAMIDVTSERFEEKLSLFLEIELEEINNHIQRERNGNN